MIYYMFALFNQGIKKFMLKLVTQLDVNFLLQILY